MFERAARYCRSAARYYRRLNLPGVPEESKGFRAAVLLAVLFSVAAAVWYGEIAPFLALAVTAGVVVGAYCSYRTRYRPNTGLKLLLTVLMLVAFGLFWSDVTGSIHDLRYPLIRLFLWLQVLHSFDLPRRRDLDFSLLSGVILIAFAGSLSISSDFLFFLVPFLAACFVALYLGHRSGLMAASDVFVGRGARLRGNLILAAVALLVLTASFFVVLPRVPAMESYYLPVSNMRGVPSSFRGLIRNPGYREFPEEFPEKPLPYNRFSYPGFSRFVDLRLRGVPRDVVVMKVRSDSPRYWRSTAFDRFLGNGWENTDREADLETIYAEDLPLSVSHAAELPRYGARQLIQTFFVERRLPNTVFSAYQPGDVFFPTRVIKVDSMLTVLVPVYLDEGLIYTVISDVSDATVQMLREAGEAYPASVKERFCRLPEMSPDVAALAAGIVEGETNQYDRVEALSRYLKNNYDYDLDCPPQEDGENSVEFFLFKQKRGFCEHFATALAVMCRTQGIPARLAVGFDTGEMNPLTGYYEVSARDAHAWVEVYFPFYGWVPFDPTPGWGEPALTGSRRTLWSGLTFFRYLGRGLSKVFPPGLRRAVGHAFRTVGEVARAFAGQVAGRWRGTLLVFSLGLLALTAVLLLRKRARREVPALSRSARERAVYLFERMSAALSDAGLKRRAGQTPLEFASEVERVMATGAVVRAASLFTSARYAREEPGPEDLLALEKLTRDVEAALPARSVGRFPWRKR